MLIIGCNYQRLYNSEINFELSLLLGRRLYLDAR